MIKPKRYHPLSILVDVWNYVKGAFFPALILFVLNYDSDTFIMKYGRYVFIIVTFFTVIFFIVKWFTHKYELRTHEFQMYSGLFKKEEQTIPYSRIQNINRRTSVLHKLFNMTSLHFETAMSGDNATVIFQAVTMKQATAMEDIIKASENNLAHTGVIESHEEETESLQEQSQSNRTVHFNPTSRDTLRASFTSFSFLILVPILLTVYANIDRFFDIEEKTAGLTAVIFTSWWMTAIVIVFAILISMVIGILRIYLKYGKYEISSDNERIYITQGVLSETSFSITKKNVQAIEMEQSLIKRMLGIVEVKLISAGKLTLDDDLEVSSLYPFLKKQVAISIMKEILPAYRITEEMNHLPKAAMWLSLLKGSLVYIIPAAVMFYFKPSIWGIPGAWWMMSILLFLLINTSIILNYWNSVYTMNDEFIQIKKGAFSSSLFISKRVKISEVKISRSFLQKKLGVASLNIVNRAQPVRHTNIAHISSGSAQAFYQWYKNRTKEITLEH